MNKNPLVSICVPVYNVAPYIERCARSLMEQNYANTEYVFVNDGSTDDTMELLEKVLHDYPKHQSQVHVLYNDRNHGADFARYVAIEKATGEYIACVDADDWIDTNYISALVQQAESGDTDMVAAPMLEHFPNRTNVLQDEFTYESLFENCLFDMVSHLCGKLLRRDILIQHQCSAPAGLNYLEDRLAMLKFSYYARTYASASGTYYHYVRHLSSSSFAKTSLHFDCLVQYWTEAERLMRQWGVWDRFLLPCQQKQVEDKTALMLQCTSNRVRRQYADLYREYELQYLKGLLPGYRLMGRLVHYHLWILISIYQIYIDWLDKRKNK